MAFLVNAYDHTPRNLSSVGWIIISVGILNGRRWAFFWTRFSIGVAAVIVVLGALLGGELSLTIFGRAVDNRGSVTLTLFAVGCWALYGWHAVRLEPPGACSVS